MSNTVFVRNEGFDKFYTKPEFSKIYIDKVFEMFDINSFSLVIEPSAGNGSFFNQINYVNKIGLDIHPEHDDIIKQDFLTFYPENKIKICVIGNPPFGKNNSLSVKFFNHSAIFSDVIAFIIPRTFRKTSIQNRLNLNFHLIYDTDVPTEPCCFEPALKVKCCFQIWEKRKSSRMVIKLPISHPDFEFLGFGEKDSKNQPTPPENPDFVIRAYGGRVGEIKTENLEKLRPKSWHWIKCKKIHKNDILKRFRELNYDCSLNSARQNSMGKSELVKLYSDFFYPEF